MRTIIKVFALLLFSLLLSNEALCQCSSQIYQVTVLDSVSCVDTAATYTRYVEVRVTNPNPSYMLAVTAYGQSVIVTGPKEVTVFPVDLPKNGNYVTITAGLFTQNLNQCSFWTMNNAIQNPVTGSCRTTPFPVDVLDIHVEPAGDKTGKLVMVVENEVNLDRYEISVNGKVKSFKPNGDSRERKLYEVLFDMDRYGENLVQVRAVDMDGSFSYYKSMALFNHHKDETMYKVWDFNRKYLGEHTFETMPRNKLTVIKGVESGELRKIVIIY